MSLAINTPRGQEALKHERDCISLYRRLYPDYSFIETDKDKPAAIDGVLYMKKSDCLQAVVEIKCRNMTHEQLFSDYGGEWLVANAKIEKGRMISHLLCVPFVGMLYLIPDKTILTIRITDSTGQYCIDFDVRDTTTKATINGGSIKQPNAFIPMEKAKEHK